MLYPFLPDNSIVFFHGWIRKTTVHKNGHNLGYAHALFVLIRFNKT